MKGNPAKSSFFLGWFFHPPSETPFFREGTAFRRLQKRVFGPVFRAVRISEQTILFGGKWVLAALLFSCIFIPRFSLGYITLSYSLDVRLEDFLLAGLALFALWVGEKKERPLGIPSVEWAFLWFLVAAEVSILNGFFFRTVDKPFLSLLYLVKWVEYFLVFWATARLAQGRPESAFFLKVFFFLGIAVAGYGHWEHFSPAAKAVYPNYYRLFERFPFSGDANHVGGLLVLWMGFFTGLLLNRKNDFTRALLFAGLLFVFFPLIWTYSRKSYLALGGVLLFSVVLQKDRREALLLVCFLALLGLVLPTRLAERVTDIRYAFGSVDPFHSSLAGNWAMWQQALWNFDKFFLWGSGLGSRHRLFYESQFVLILAETGLVGFAAFLFLCLAPARKILARFNQPLAPEEKAIGLGWLIGFSGLMIHNLSCVSLTVTKVAIPFWFLTAAVLGHLVQPREVRRSRDGSAPPPPPARGLEPRAGTAPETPGKPGASSAVKVQNGLHQVLKTSLVVFIFLVGAKLLNFLKKILIGQLFGVSAVADAFFAASYLPYYVAIFFEGILFLGFLPIFSQVTAEKGREEAGRFAVEVLFLALLLTGILAGLAVGGAPWVIRELVPGFSAAEQTLTRSLFQILSLLVIFISLTSFFKALNSYFEHYAFAASSGLVDTVVMIGVTLAGWRFWGIYGAAWGSVAGAFTALVVQAFFLFRRHLVFPKRFVFRTNGVHELFYFLLPMGAIWAFQQIPIVILNRFGSGMWEGTISALAISQTLTTVPMGLVSHTVLFAIFPSLAKQAHQTTREELRQTFFQTLRGGYFILVPIGFLLTALARPLTVLFFAGGGITMEGTQRIANSLTCFGWATFVLYADLFMTQSLITVRRTLPAIFLSGCRAVLTYALGYILSTYWDYQGLAFSFSLALAVNFFIFFPFFFRWSPFSEGWGELFRYSSKLILASSPLFLIGRICNRWSITEWTAFPAWALVLILGFGFLGGIGLYLFLLSRLKVKEIGSVFGGIKQAWVQKRWWLGDQGD